MDAEIWVKKTAQRPKAGERLVLRYKMLVKQRCDLIGQLSDRCAFSLRKVSLRLLRRNRALWAYASHVSSELDTTCSCSDPDAFVLLLDKTCISAEKGWLPRSYFPRLGARSIPAATSFPAGGRSSGGRSRVVVRVQSVTATLTQMYDHPVEHALIKRLTILC